jgi:LysR family hydrogen peroxide-inducible transcriptional activator
MAARLYAHVQKLWLFSRVAEHRSFKRAAADAGITLSAMSQSITSLERVLGKTLVVRSRSPLILTEEGEDVLAHATPVLAAIAALDARGRHASAAKRTKLRLGLYDTIAENHLPHLLPRLQREFPNLVIELRTARSAALERLLRDGDLDAIVVVRDPGVRDTQADILGKGELGFFVSASEHEPTWNLVGSKGIALFAPSQGGHTRYQRTFLDSHAAFFREAGIQWRIVLTGDSLETLCRLAASGLLVSVLPLRAAMRFPNEVVMLRAPASARLDRGAHEFCLVTREAMDPALRRVLRRELISVLDSID